MSRFHVVNVWTDAEPGASAFSPMAPSLLWLPDEFEIGQPRPAVVFVHGWGAYPHATLPRGLGEQLSASGYVFLSLCLRRRGMEGQLTAMPDDDIRDIKLAVDYLHLNGARGIVLAGQEFGAWSAVRYQARSRDSRVRGVAAIDPVGEPSAWLREVLGADPYRQALRDACVAARQGAGMDYRIDLFPAEAPAVTQQAAAFLSWWAPSPDHRWMRVLEALAAPLRVFSASPDKVPAALADTLEPGSLVEAKTGDAAALSTGLCDWAESIGVRRFGPTGLDIVDVDAGKASLYGLHWTPAESSGVRTAVMLLHGLSSSPTSPLFARIAPVLAQSGLAALAVETFRSGWAGHETALLDDDLVAMDAWTGFLLQRGFDRIVLAGASMGSLSIGRYQALRQHPNVIGLAHLMPTADCPEWFARAAGNGRYEEAVRAAREAVGAGRGGETLIDIDVRQPPPSLSRGRFRWTQRADSWLSWWGPDADSRSTAHISGARVPVLLLSGTTDSYNDKARFAELRAAATRAPRVDEIWYEDIDHGLSGAEDRVADDLRDWILGLE